jgi:hypothetical protein
VISPKVKPVKVKTFKVKTFKVKTFKVKPEVSCGSRGAEGSPARSSGRR